MTARTRSKALALAFFTVAYNLVERGVAMLGAALSGSNALLGFGLDSFVESLSGMVMVWRFWKFDPAADDEEFEQVERKAARLVADPHHGSRPRAGAGDTAPVANSVAFGCRGSDLRAVRRGVAKLALLGARDPRAAAAQSRLDAESR